MLGAVISGGHVTKVVLHPCTISRTDVFPNPHPLFVVWAGPIVGTLLPLLAFLLTRFFAGFCLVANGVYIGFGSIQGIGDAGDMLRYDSFRWQLTLFSIIIITLGFYLWNGLGSNFGLGKTKGTVSRRAALASLILFVILVRAELAIGNKY